MAYPWAVDVPQLLQSITIYRNHMVEAAKIDKAYQPFIQLIWGDKLELFPRKDLGPLIAVAYSTDRPQNVTLASYYCNGRFMSVVEAFHLERERRERKRHSRMFTPESSLVN